MNYLRVLLNTMSPMKYLLFALASLVIADGLITQFLVTGGLAREGNPFMQALVGESTFILVKVLGALVCTFIMWDIYKRRARLALISTSCMVTCYGAIVIWNICAFFIATA